MTAQVSPKFPFSYTDNGKQISIVLDFRPRIVDDTHANFLAVREAIKKVEREWDAMKNGSWPDSYQECTKRYALGLDELRTFISLPKYIAAMVEGLVEISDTGEVRHNGVQVHGFVAARLYSMLLDGRNPRPLMRFMDRLAKNPVPTAADELYRWLEKGNMPLTQDGCFLAYKHVSQEFKDMHSGRFDNSVGAVIPRLAFDEINTDREQTCAASGYHFCSFGYWAYAQGRHVMVIKIAPEDVSSFPHSEEHKGRCVFYTVEGEVPSEEAFNRDPLGKGPTVRNTEGENWGSTDDRLAEAAGNAWLQPKAAEDVQAAADDMTKRLAAQKRAGSGAKAKRAKLTTAAYTKKQLRGIVKREGQRGAERLTGIPRTTLRRMLGLAS